MMRCDQCRYWSEMLAQAGGGAVAVEAFCLSQDSPYAGQYTTGSRGCDKGKDNRYGAIDAPPNYGEATRAAYEADEGGF